MPYYVLVNNACYIIECQEADRPADPWIEVAYVREWQEFLFTCTVDRASNWWTVSFLSRERLPFPFTILQFTSDFPFLRGVDKKLIQPSERDSVLCSCCFGGAGSLSMLLKSMSTFLGQDVSVAEYDRSCPKKDCSILSFFWKRKRKLMRLPCCLYVCVSSPGIARQWLDNHSPTAMHTDATVKEPLDVFSMRPVLC
jgi:hypothetical protein